MQNRPGSLLTRESPIHRVGFIWQPQVRTHLAYSAETETRGPAPTGPCPSAGSCRLDFHPDLPDARDLELDPIKLKSELYDPVRRTLERIRRANVELEPGLQDSVRSFLLREQEIPLEGAACDLRDTGCLSAVRDHRDLRTGAPSAVLALVEYLLRAGAGIDEEFSVRFLYQVTRRSLGWSGDAGSSVRATLKALRRFGAPPEPRWAYSTEAFDVMPDAAQFAYASDFREMTYARLDSRNQDPAHTLDLIRQTLMDGFPITFGFPMYSSIDEISGGNRWTIPVPRGARGERLLGGQTVLAIGFDDSHDNGDEGPGALLVQNSWGSNWGDAGCAHLPYSYLLRRLATDFWTVFNPRWIALDPFE